MQELKDTIDKIGELAEIIDKMNGTQCSGSWEWREILTASDSKYQVLESWDRDGLKTPMPYHKHEESLEIIIVVDGGIAITLKENGIESINCVEEESVFVIPVGIDHYSYPEPGTRCIVVLIPAEKAYRSNS